MSKYDRLWEYIRDNGNDAMELTFDEIRDITGIEIDHSFLNYKKELTQYFPGIRRTPHDDFFGIFKCK